MKTIFLLFMSLILKGFSNEVMIIKNFNSKQILEKRGDVFLRTSPCSSFKIALSLMGYEAIAMFNLHR